MKKGFCCSLKELSVFVPNFGDEKSESERRSLSSTSWAILWMIWSFELIFRNNHSV